MSNAEQDLTAYSTGWLLGALCRAWRNILGVTWSKTVYQYRTQTRAETQAKSARRLLVLHDENANLLCIKSLLLHSTNWLVHTCNYRGELLLLHYFTVCPYSNSGPCLLYVGQICHKIQSAWHLNDLNPSARWTKHPIMWYLYVDSNSSVSLHDVYVSIKDLIS